MTTAAQAEVLRYRETLVTYQQGSAQPLERLKAVVDSCTYKGWILELDERERGGEHMGAGYGWTLSISFTVQNSVAPGQITSLHYFPVPPATWDAETWERWVLDCIIECETHEAMEFIRFGDRAQFFRRTARTVEPVPDRTETVRLIPILTWYDEPTWALAEPVASIAAAGADHLVAVDGAYMLYPEGRAQSPGEQAQTIMATAQGAGMGVTVHIPQDVWFGNEVEKRSFTFAAGHMVAEPGEDWLWVVDADERIQEALGLREALEQTSCDVATLMIDEVNGGSREGAYPLRKFFRAQETGIHLEDNHFTYMTGDGQMLFEGYCIAKSELVEADNFPFVRIDHRGGRSDARNQQARSYYERRKEHEVEVVPA